MSIAVNAGLFWLFESYFGWNSKIAYALSLTITTALLFLWNYVVGFKTDRHWTDSAWRQIACQVVAFALNYALVTFLHDIFPQWKELVIAAVTIFISFFKFGLYHYWVYPQRGAELSVEPATRTP
jgi:putative flippase GtrA